MSYAVLLFGILASWFGASAGQPAKVIRVGSVWVPLPPGAFVVPHPHGHGIFGGTRVRLEDRLTVEVAARPASPRALRAYVDSVVASRNAQLRPAWQLEPPRARSVGGRTAWVLRPHCGDCEAVEAYLDFPGTRFVVAWGVDGLEGLTVAERHALAWRFVASLRSIGAPSTPATDRADLMANPAPLP